MYDCPSMPSLIVSRVKKICAPISKLDLTLTSIVRGGFAAPSC